MPLSLLDVIRGHGRGDAWPDSGIKGLDVAPCIQSCHDPLLICIYDQLNYACYLPYYYKQMSSLSTTHPNVHSQFMNARWLLSGTRTPFGRIPVDQTIEVTVNKDTQTPGGTKGFSLKPGAVSQYYLTSEYNSSYLRQLRNMLGRDSSQQL